MKRILITGFNGFVGRHACVEFKRRGFNILGVTDKIVDEDASKIVDETMVCDLSEPTETSGLALRDIDAVLNLAGFATNTGTDEERVHRINIGAHVNLYERILELGLTPRIIAVSTGLVYEPTQTMPINESGVLRDPTKARPYEASKVLMERSLEPLKKSELDIVIARPFNHTGPGQRGGFIVPDLAEQIEKHLEAGEAIKTGNLTTMRDYTDVRDVVRAYADLAEATTLRHDTYNICSGIPRMGAEILEMLSSEYGVQNPARHESSAKLRPGEIAEFYGDNTRISVELGWVPLIDLPQTINEYVLWRKSTKLQA